MKQFKNRQNECVTTTDGRKIWAGRNVAVVGVFLALHKKNLYVVAEKRGQNPNLDNRGRYCVPCGYLDWDETTEEAIRREAWEEIGFDIDDLLEKYKITTEGNYIDSPWGVNSDPTSNRQNVSIRYGMCLIVPDEEQLPKLTPNNDCEPDEVGDAFWIDLGYMLTPNYDVLKQYDFAFKHDKLIQEFVEKTLDEI